MLDLKYMAFHAKFHNQSSIGIELASRGDASEDPRYYRARPHLGRREATTCRIHDHVYLAWKFTDAQLTAFLELARALRFALPNIPIEYPQSRPGVQAWHAIHHAHKFRGYLGHYHTLQHKWDPGPFDFRAFCDRLKGQLCFPIAVRGGRAETPLVPADAAQLEADSNKLYSCNEVDAQGGFFPLAPSGQSRLWHGGVHLIADRGARVYAPFPGRILAARMGGSSAVGSTNFVLMRHDITLGKHGLRFFSLFYHLEDTRNAADPPPWVARLAAKGSDFTAEVFPAGAVVLLDEPVEGAEVIGHVGVAGPEEQRAAQIHFEIFSTDDLFEEMDPQERQPWQLIDGGTSRFADDTEIVSAIDVGPKDGKLSRSELLGFFRGSAARLALRNKYVYSASEWAGNDWTETLTLARDFEHYSPAEIHAMVEEEIAPQLFWERVRKHARLPQSGLVYHYHPITFVKFVGEKLLLARQEGLPGSFPIQEARSPTSQVTDDLADVDNAGWLDESELEEYRDDSSEFSLERLVLGFDK